jgi:HEAT repeat protein
MSRVSTVGMEREIQEVLRRLRKMEKTADYWLQQRHREGADPENLQALWTSLGGMSQCLDVLYSFQPTLLKALESADSASRCHAASLLIRMGVTLKPNTLVNILEEAFASTDTQCRRNAARMMFELKSKGLPLLNKALVDRDEHVRSWGLKLAQALGKEALPALPALIELIRVASQTSGADIPNIQLRAEACDLISEWGPAAVSAAKVLLAVSEERFDGEDNRYLRLRAVRALHEVSSNPKQVVKVAIEILETKAATIQVDDDGNPIDDGSYWPRVWACDLMGELGKEAASAIPKLEKLLKEEENATVRAAAEEALRSIGK